MLQFPYFSSAFFVYLTILSFLAFATSKPDGFSLELIPNTSPESPFYPGNLTVSERINRIVKSSEIRAHNLDLLNSKSSFSPETLRFNLSQSTSGYLVKLRLGTPAIPLYLVPDSGSDLFWVQCEPCIHRFRQLPPIFNSTASHTYRDLPCHHPFCRNNPNVFHCRHDKCIYRLEYTGGSSTEGIAAQEILQSASNEQIPFYFGCSRNNENFQVFEHSGRTAGIMGLNTFPVSLLMQLDNITRHRFSYCLNPFDFNSPSRSTSLLRFGSDVPERGRRFSSTPFVHSPHNPNYFLKLLDISISGQRMHFSPEIFALKLDGSGGTIIDSGTTLTFIAQPAYNRVLNVLMNYFDFHGFQQIHIPESTLDPCYRRPSNASFSDFPSMTFHFQGADLHVQPEYVYLAFGSHFRSAFCFALKPTASRSVIGSVNQANTRFIYDAGARQLRFSPENCQRDRI